MENQNSKMFFLSLKYGLYLGIIYVIFSLLIYIFDVNMLSIGFSIIYFLISAAVVIILLVLGMKHARDRIFDGSLAFGKRFLVGFIIGLIGGWISGIFSIALFYYYDPGFMNMQAEQLYEKLISYGVDEAQALEQETKLKEGFTLAGRLKSLYLTSPGFSAVLSLIVAAFVKKELNKDDGKVI